MRVRLSFELFASLSSLLPFRVEVIDLGISSATTGNCNARISRIVCSVASGHRLTNESVLEFPPSIAIPRWSPSRHKLLCRRNQRKLEILLLDRQFKWDFRRRQNRVPSVRFYPLAYRRECPMRRWACPETCQYHQHSLTNRTTDKLRRCLDRSAS